MTGTDETNLNPYVGPRTFDTEQRKYYYGRDEEIAILEGQVLSRRASVFFAQSGAGKSSLLRAGLIPELTKETQIGRGKRARTYKKMNVLPILTISGGIPGGMQVPIANIFVFATLVNLYPPETDCDDLAELTMSQGLAPFLNLFSADRRSQATGPEVAEEVGHPLSPTLLIFDQFEELFTHYTDRWREREGFFRQVCQALEDYPDLHVLFTMREDFIAELTPYANLLPQGLRDRFRLELLKREAALLAVTEPARVAGRTFAEGVAEGLVDNLRRSQPGRQKEDDKPAHEQALGAYVEPVHLQIVCRQLWDQLPPDRTVIETADVRAFGDVDQALIGFYEATLEDVFKKHSSQEALSERRLRAWFDEELITPARTRGLVYRGETDTVGLPNAAVDILGAAYIVRARVRGPDTWHELAHDRLVGPVLQANQAWREGQGPILADAERWEAEGRDSRSQYLYDGRQLKKELAVEEGHATVPLVREFLEASQQWVKRRRRRRRYRIAGFVVGPIALLVLVFWILLANFEREVRQATRMTINYSGQTLLVTEPESLEEGSPIYLFDLEGAQPELLGELEGHTGEIYTAAISSDQRFLATVSYDGTVRIWDLENLKELNDGPLHEESGADFTAVAFSPTMDFIAWGSIDGSVEVYDFVEEELFSLPLHPGLIHTLSFSPDERYLFVVAEGDQEEIFYYPIDELASYDQDDEPNFLSFE